MKIRVVRKSTHARPIKDALVIFNGLFASRDETPIDKRFGSVLVLGTSKEKMSGNLTYDCMCDCGSVRKITASRLRNHPPKGCSPIHCKTPVIFATSSVRSIAAKTKSVDLIPIKRKNRYSLSS